MATKEQIYASFFFDEAPDPTIIGFTLESMSQVGAAAIRAEMRDLGYPDPGKLNLTDSDLLSFYRDHAEKLDASISSTYNAMLLNQIDNLPEGLSIGEARFALSDFFDRVHAYNQNTLIPFTTNTARQQAISAFYQNNTSPLTGRSLADSVQWDYIRGSGSTEPDECGDAEAASPSSYDDLVSVAGGEPPEHQNCECILQPNEDVAEHDLPAEEDLWTGSEAA